MKIIRLIFLQSDVCCTISEKNEDRYGVNRTLRNFQTCGISVVIRVRKIILKLF